VSKKAFVPRAEDCGPVFGDLMRIFNFLCNFVSSLVFFSLGLGVYQVWFSCCVTRWPDLRRLFVKM
jgi:hypothetical protein